MAGIDSLKALLLFVFQALGAGLEIDKNSDGKISIAEILATITPLAFKFPNLYEALPYLKEEFKDLDDAELKELAEYFANLDLPAKFDNLEEVIKLSVDALHYNYNFIKKVKALV